MSVEIIAERTVFRGRKLRVIERDIRFSEGTVVTREVMDRGGDSVAIVAIDEDLNVILVEEFFGGTNERGLSLPKGMIDPPESPEDAAARELREEIGMGGRLEKLLTMTVSPGYLTQRTEVFLATDLYRDPLPGDEVDITPITLPLGTALAMCVDGQITEARTIGSLLVAARKLRSADFWP